MNKNPEQNEREVNKNISKILNPIDKETRNYLEVQREIIRSVFER